VIDHHAHLVDTEMVAAEMIGGRQIIVHIHRHLVTVATVTIVIVIVMTVMLHVTILMLQVILKRTSDQHMQQRTELYRMLRTGSMKTMMMTLT
jgi:hypothetical protein